MKKLRLTLVMLIATMSIQAQILTPNENTVRGYANGLYYIPSNYSSDGKAYIVINENYYKPDEDTQLSIYDDKLNKIKTIHTNEAENRIAYTVVKKRIGDTEEWEETVSYTGNYRNIMFIGQVNYNDEIYDCKSIIISQTLFNNDDAYEYIIPIYTYLISTYESTSRIETSYNPVVTGFNIVSENGDILQTVNLPENLFADNLSIYKINNETYLGCRASKLEDNGYINTNSDEAYNIFYSIANGGNTRIQQVGEPIKTRVYPTVAGRNETITVELDSNGNGEKEIFVSNAAGQTVYHSKVAAGQKQVQINASGLSRGMNIISVKGNGGKADSNKVIVK